MNILVPMPDPIRLLTPPLKEEKCVRAAQILENERGREKERTEKKNDEDRALEECKLKLSEEKEAQVL